MKKRLTAMILALAMVLSVTPLPASAADTVSYNRASGKLYSAILNAVNGSNSKFINSDNVSHQYFGYTLGAYNAATNLFPSIVYNSSNTGGNATIKGDVANYADSLTCKVQNSGQLEFSMSFQLHNYSHKHSRTQGVNYETATLNLNNDQLSITGLSASESTDARVGLLTTGTQAVVKLDYMYSCSKLEIEFGSYSNISGCKHKETKASYPIFVYRDAVAPSVTSVNYSGSSNPTQVNTSAIDGYFRKGATIKINVEFDEPIRFSDDSASGKESLTAGLIVSGQTEKLPARLVSLDNKTLTFQYDVTGEEGNLTITGIDLSSFFGTGLKLRQLKPDSDNGLLPEAYDLDAAYLKQLGITSTAGYTTTTSYITDIAGNPVSDKTKTYDLSNNKNIHIDCTAPYVTSVEPVITASNQEVKTARNMVGKETDPGYADDSDTRLSPNDEGGDKIGFTVTLNEKTQGAALKYTKYYNQYWVATTNVKRSGKYVTLEQDSIWTDEKLGVTKISFKPMTLQAGDTIDSSVIPSGSTMNQNSIVLTGIAKDQYKSNYITEQDCAGNYYAHVDLTTLNTNAAVFDAAAPAVTIGETGFSDGYFVVPLTLSDAEGTSFVGLSGKLTLTAYDANDKAVAFSYKYYINDAKGVDASALKSAKTPQTLGFDQVAGTSYIYLKADAAEELDIKYCKLNIQVSDYAGNKGSQDIKIDWKIDTTAPKVKAGKTARSLDGVNGVLTVDVNITDSSEIKAWQYSWDGGASWIDGATSGADAYKAKSPQISNGTLFSEELSVKAEDINGNKSAAYNLGSYSYDLTAASYTLTQSSDFAASASLSIDSLGASDALVFAVEDRDNAGTYFVKSFSSTDENIFATASGWMHAVITTSGAVNTSYTFTSSGSGNAIKQLVGGTYTGDLNIQVFAGKAASISSGSNTIHFSAEINEVSQSELFLRVDSASSSAAAAYGAPTLTAGFTITDGMPTSYGSGADTSYDAVDTLAGKTMTVTLGEDIFGWNFADIDITASALCVEHLSTEDATPDLTYEVPMVLANTQTITFPSNVDYPSGFYRIYLKLVTTSGRVYSWNFTQNNGCYFFLDNTIPTDDIVISSAKVKLINSGLYNYDGEYECATGDNTIYLPINGLGRDEIGRITFDADSLTLTVKNASWEPDLIAMPKSGLMQTRTGYFSGSGLAAVGRHKTIVQNTTFKSEEAKEYLSASQSGDNNGAVTINSAMHLGAWYTQDGGLYLFQPSQWQTGDNLVTISQLYQNGRSSGTVTYNLKVMTPPSGGTLTTTDTKLVLTPIDMSENAQVTAYVMAYPVKDPTSVNQSVNYDSETGLATPYEMQLQADGTWTYPLVEGGAVYYVYMQSDYGSVTKCGSISQWPYTVEGGEFFSSRGDKGEALFNVSFTILDDIPEGEGLDLELGFNDEYLRFAGIEGADTLKLKLGADGEINYTDELGTVQGITSVTGYKLHDDPNYNNVYEYVVKVTGYPCGYTAEEEALKPDMAMTLTVSGGFGETVSVVRPCLAEDWLNGKPWCAAVLFYDCNAGYYESTSDKEVVVFFDVPVVPTANFMLPEVDGLTPSRQWADSFPIVCDGDHEISYTDIFGRTWTETVTMDQKMFGSGLDISFSETETTNKPVTVTVTAGDNHYIVLLDKNGNFLDDNAENAWYNSSSKTYTAVDNTAITVRICEGDCWDGHDASSSGSYYPYTEMTFHITNIVKTAPEANLHFYLEGRGQLTESQLMELVEDQGGKLNTAGSVRVSYTTSRHVTPAEDTPAEYVVSSEGVDCRFVYVDDNGLRGEKTVRLEDYGLVLTTGEELLDNVAPIVTADIYVKYNNAYVAADSLSASSTDAEIAQAFADAGLAQAYSLTVNVVEDSEYTIAIDPADSDKVSLKGNVITVLEPVDFTVSVTDHPKDVGKNKGTPHTTSFTVKADYMKGQFDTVAPTLESYTVTGENYNTVMVINAVFGDKKNDNTTGGAITVVYPNMTQEADGSFTLRVTENGTTHIVFRDSAGNTASADVDVQSIYTDAPVLTTSWSPSFENQMGERGSTTPPRYRLAYDQEGLLDYSSSTFKLNSYVTARINSDVPIFGAWLNGLMELTETNIPYYFDDKCNNETYDDELVKTDPGYGPVIVRQSDAIVVTFRDEDAVSIFFDIYGPNGRDSVEALSLSYVIDTKAPDITVTTTPSTRDGASLPYRYQYTLTPDEYTVCQNDSSGGSKLYDDSTPMVLSFSEGGTHNYFFRDLAGNVTIKTITVPFIDKTAPVITKLDDGSTQTITGGSVDVKVQTDEDCTITCDGASYQAAAGTPVTITITQNGTYTITATDATGNYSRTSVTIGNIDRIQPTVYLLPATVRIRQDSTVLELDTVLKAGVTLSDNMTAADKIAMDIDSSAVDLTTPGVYAAVFTAKDEAGNERTVTRFVKVFDKNTPILVVDGQATDSEATYRLTPGVHTLTADGLAEIAGGIYEPYTIRIIGNVYYLGQMKSGKGSTLLPADGKYNFTPGYYTVTLTTQSRKTVLMNLFVQE